MSIVVGTGAAAPPAPPPPPGAPNGLLGAPAPSLPATGGGGSLAGPIVVPSAALTVTTSGQAAADPASLLMATQPIILPDFTLMGGDSSALMLPAMPEVSSLPAALAAAAKRFTQTAASHVTFIDPVSGLPAQDTTPPPWVFVDATETAGAFSGGKIQWGRKG